MLHPGAISIQRVILHEVHRRPSAGAAAGPPTLDLADLVSPLDPEICQFLAAHVRGGLDDYRARRARFTVGQGGNPVLDLCDTMFGKADDEATFVSQSRLLATRLIDSVTGRQGPDARIQDGDLLVCQLTIDDGSGPIPIVALLKVDPRSGLRRERRATAAGRIQVILSPVSGLLTETRLQKCAFVLPSDRRAQLGHDLVVLDLQTDGRNATRWVASYFIDRFLLCEVGLNANEQLRVFIYESGTWVDTSSGLDEAEKERVKDRVIQVTYDPTIDVVAFAGEVLTDLDRREAYLAHLRSKGLVDLLLEPNPQRRAELADFITFEGDDRLTVRVRRDAYGTGRAVDPGPGPGPDGVRTITIRTTTWQPRRPVGP